MLLSPLPLLVETNADSDEEPTVPSKLLLNLPDEIVPSSRGIPLHTRYTRRNQIQVTNFRNLIHVEVLGNLHIMLNPNVVQVIELYTFERTHPVVPHKRTEHPLSLFRDGDILDLLTPCEQYANHNNCEEDYVMQTLIGRVLYGFDIHDSRYSTIDDKNPCEIMTNEGGIYLVPDQMSDWFLYKDGECVPLPVLQRFKHCITDARLIASSSGPFLRLVLEPVQSLIPGQDFMLQGTKLGSGLNWEDSDLESFTSSNIDLNLMNISTSTTEDSFDVEIANSWNSSRESALVVLSSPTLDFENEYKEESENEDKVSDDGSPRGESTGVIPLHKSEQKDASQDLLSPSTTPERSSITSLGPVDLDFLSGASDDESESEDFSTHSSLMSRRPSLIADTNPQVPIILELGAGVIGFQDLSMSYLHTITTPNPSSYCSHCRDENLESIEL